MDNDQDQRFRDAVERKKEESEAASHATQHGAPGDERGGIQGDQENLRSTAEPQDTFSTRDKNTRHRKVTADKWNQ